MAKGGYKSEEFIDLCDFAGNYSLVRYLKDREKRKDTDKDTELRNLTAAIDSQVPEAIKLWMSKLIFQYKGLEHEIGSSLFSKTKKLNPIYHNALKEIQTMNLDPSTVLQALIASGQQNNNVSNLLSQLGGQSNMVRLNIGGQTVTLPVEQALAVKQMIESRAQQQQQGGVSNVLAALGIGGGNPGGNSNVASALAALGIGGGEKPSLLGYVDGVSAPQSTARTITPSAPSNSLMKAWKEANGEPYEEVEIPSVVTDVNPMNLG
ncbi:hypothetical protein ACPF8X_41770, partial [Streptomyces sp. G35A]